MALSAVHSPPRIRERLNALAIIRDHLELSATPALMANNDCTQRST